MKAIYFKRVVMTHHIHNTYIDESIYFPEHNILFGIYSTGSFSGSNYSIIDESINKEYLDLIKPLSEGKVPDEGEKVTYSNIKEFDMDISEEQLGEILKKAKLQKELKKTVESFVKENLDPIRNLVNVQVEKQDFKGIKNPYKNPYTTTFSTTSSNDLNIKTS